MKEFSVSLLDKRKVYRIFIIAEVISLCLVLGEWIYIQKSQVKSVERPDQNEDAIEEELEADVDGVKQDVIVQVSPKALSKKQEVSLIEKAKTEIDESFPGENSSLDNVRSNLVVEEKYCNGQVEADWYFDDYKKVSPDGELDFDEIKEVTLVNVMVTLTCGSSSEIYEFSFVVKPMSTNSKEGIAFYLQQALKQANTSLNDELQLPLEVQGKKIKWKRKYSFLGLKLGGLALLIYVAIQVACKAEKKQEKMLRQTELRRDYPKIVESLSLYIGAGLSVKNAINRIAYEAQVSGRNTAGFAGVMLLSKKLQDGIGEQEAYRILPELCPAKEYRKLSAILLSNLKKGTKGLGDILQAEEDECFELQKNHIKQMGEEASTKLLLPMVGLLGLVLMILIVPALINIQI